MADNEIHGNEIHPQERINDNPPSMDISPGVLTWFVKNGYELKLYNRKLLRASVVTSRILIPVVPVIGSVLRRDFSFERDGELFKRADEAGCVKVDVECNSELMCDVRTQLGVLLQIPEVYAYIASFCDREKCFSSSHAMFRQFCDEGLADDFSKTFRNHPLDFAARGIHVGAVLRIVNFMEDSYLRDARRGFLDCGDFSRDGLRSFCLNSGRRLNIRKGSKEA